jgi:hypothetical protein
MTFFIPQLLIEVQALLAQFLSGSKADALEAETLSESETS